MADAPAAEAAGAAVDAEALGRLLGSRGLEHVAPSLAGRSLGSLILWSDDRVAMLALLRELGVAKLSDRQSVANAIAKHRRSLPPRQLDPSAEHPVLSAPELTREYGIHGGGIGLLLRPDGSCTHVNERPKEHWGSHTFSVGLQQPKLDGPIVAEVARLASLVGRPVYVAFCDEDPFVPDPHQAFARPATGVAAEKLAAFRAALGQDVVVLCTAWVRGVPSDPCVGLLPAYDSWARPDADDPSMASLRRQMLCTLPHSKRIERAVWRGAGTGNGGAAGTSSLRSRLIEHCARKRWADVAVVGDMHQRGTSQEGEPVYTQGELRRDQQAAYRCVLCVDGHTWASAWEWVLSTGAAVIFVGVWSLHLLQSMAPWEHYVPCECLDDLEARVEWVLGHPAEAEAMAARAYAVFQRVATREHTMRCVGVTLAKMSR